MGSKCNAVFPLFLTVNILFFALVSATLPKPPTITKSPPPPTPVSWSPPPPPGSVSNSPPPSSSTTCPIDALKLGVCANLLGVVNVTIGTPPTLPCCSLIGGVLDLEAAVCLCTAIKLNILQILNVDVNVAISLILNNCGKKVPEGFRCP